MFPLVGIPATIAKFLKSYRQVFGKEAGFQHISRYINGLLISPNKTLQGIYSQLVWDEENQVSRRAMHEAVFEALIVRALNTKKKYLEPTETKQW